jgi:hypothetical protein
MQKLDDHGLPEYLVRWVGYTAEHDQWEPLSNLAGCRPLLEAFEAARAAAAIPPKRNPLYSNVLTLIFAYGSRKELAILPRVCKDWQVALKVTPPLQFHIDMKPVWVDRCRDRLDQICFSSSRKHISTMNLVRIDSRSGDWIVGEEEMRLLRVHLPHLLSLRVTLKTKRSRVEFPPSLQELDLIDLDETDAADFQRVIDSVGQAQNLETLSAWCKWNGYVDDPANSHNDISFAPLSQNRKLTSLQLTNFTFSEADAVQLRSMPQLRSLHCVNGVPPCILLASPHQFQLMHLGCVSLRNEEDASALVTLPTLTSLDVWVHIPHVDFLLQLPSLTTLEIKYQDDTVVDIPRVLTAMRTLVKLTELHFRGLFSSEQMGQLLQHLPLLSQLRLSCLPSLVSLSFLSKGTLVDTLTELELVGNSAAIPLTDLDHVRLLRNLHEFSLQTTVFDAKLSEETTFLYAHQPPSLIPTLKRFTYF